MAGALSAQSELPPYSVEQAAERLGTHPDTVRASIKKPGGLRHFRIGRRIFIPRRWLDCLIAEGGDVA